MLPLMFVDLSNVHFTVEANKIVIKQPLSSPKESPIFSGRKEQVRLLPVQEIKSPSYQKNKQQ